jgi:VWFA-related protein
MNRHTDTVKTSPILLRPWWILLLVSSLLPAQQSPDRPKPAQANTADVLEAPTFKTRTDLVLVPVVVRDHKGNHIPGLTQDAFHLEENGKDQTISLFEEIHAATNAPPPAPILDRGYSNLPFDNASELRLTIIVLDLLNTTPLQRTDGKDQLIKFLSKGLAQNQPVSLLCLTNHDLQLVHPFTTDTSSLIQVLKKLPLGPPKVMPRRDAAEKTLKQLTEIAQGYIGIPGRKTMIFAAGDIPEPMLDRAVYPTDLVTAQAFQETFKTLVDANISVYPFELMAWASDPTLRSHKEYSDDQSLREFADATGGNRCIESNDLMKCFAEAVEDSRSYYMLGFSVRPDDRKPGWRNLKVNVSAEHTNVRARNGFYYGNPASPGPQSAHDAEINALASPLPYSAVPMYVRVLPPAAVSTAPSMVGQKIAVEFLVTIPLTSIKLDSSSATPLDLEIGAIALTSDPREVADFLHPVHGNPNPELLQKFTREGIKLREKLDLLPGTYDIRFMVHDNNTNQIGTVVFPLDVK